MGNLSNGIIKPFFQQQVKIFSNHWLPHILKNTVSMHRWDDNTLFHNGIIEFILNEPLGLLSIILETLQLLLLLIKVIKKVFYLVTMEFKFYVTSLSTCNKGSCKGHVKISHIKLLCNFNMIIVTCSVGKTVLM